MFEFNKIYLGHNFEEYNDYGCDDYKCKICGIVVYFNDDVEGLTDNEDDQYNIIVNDEIEESSIINCNEWIIKNIIE